MGADIVRIRTVFSGRVQGVFFRANAKRYSDEAGVTGWVRNTSDGKVEALFEGQEAAVRAVIASCRTGQPYAEVASVEEYAEHGPPQCKSFEIRY